MSVIQHHWTSSLNNIIEQHHWTTSLTRICTIFIVLPFYLHKWLVFVIMIQSCKRIISIQCVELKCHLFIILCKLVAFDLVLKFCVLFFLFVELFLKLISNNIIQCFGWIAHTFFQTFLKSLLLQALFTYIHLNKQCTFSYCWWSKLFFISHVNKLKHHLVGCRVW